MKIKDPLVELLAIKLYEHDDKSGAWPPLRATAAESTRRFVQPNWIYLSERFREKYRDMARGVIPLEEQEK